MSNIIRLDKFLCEMGTGSRREIKDYAKKGRIRVNGVIEKSSDRKIDSEKDEIMFDNRQIKYVKYEYYMLNKPAGIVSATVDNKDKTVIDLIDSVRKKELFPVGRLDKDTVGLLLITNDGELAHNLLSPSKHIDKKYYVKIEGSIAPDTKEIFEKGIQLSDGDITKPAVINILSEGKLIEAEIIISEGKYHQVKRMVAAVGGKVTYLKRLSMGGLELDMTLQEGKYRELTQQEIEILKRGRND